MTTRLSLTLLFFLLAISVVAAEALRYPETRKGDVVETLHGVSVADPYRWLEDLDGAETQAWIAAQNRVTAAHLEGLPQREALRRRLTTLWDYPRTGLPVREAGRLFYLFNSGLEQQARLLVRETLAAEPRVLLDPNALSPDGSVALGQWAVSPDGRYLAYGLAEGGADWETLRVREIATGRDLAERVRWFRFSGIAWTRDGRGFFYARYPEPAAGQELSAELIHHRVYYHRVGTEQSQDALVYEQNDLPRWFVGASVTEDGRYLLVTLSEGTAPRNRLYCADLGDPLQPQIDAPLRPLVDDDAAEFLPLGNRGPLLLVRTDLEAPRRKVLALDVRQGAARAGWKVVVPEGALPLEDVVVAGGRIFAHRLADVQSRIDVFDLDGRPQGEVALPGVGTVSDLGGRGDGDELFFVFTSPLEPKTVLRYEVPTRRVAAFAETRTAFERSAYETTQVFVTSKDGTRVPMFVTARKGLVRDGSHPLWLYAYGGFGISMPPTFSPARLVWLELGGISVTVNLRGGAEYGEEWHRAGMFEKKQNVFDDFIAAAEQLVREGYTRPERIVIRGGSNGGLLVGAVMTQRPELFGVALPAMGVMDMLRFHKFTGGVAWTTEYGSPDEAAAFASLRAYSPLHNLKAGACYPATLVTTADHDDRVVPSHSFKFAAALQAAQACGRPTLIRIETSGSHTYSSTDKSIAEWADIYAFVTSQLGLSVSGLVGAQPTALGAGMR